MCLNMQFFIQIISHLFKYLLSPGREQVNTFVKQYRLYNVNKDMVYIEAVVNTQLKMFKGTPFIISMSPCKILLLQI